MTARPRTRYATGSGVDIAYQVIGDGPIDLLLLSGYYIPIDCMDDEPSLAEFQRRLASFARVIRFDVRGLGLSERGSPASPPSLEERAQDAIAVLDAVGAERAVVIAPWQSSPEGVVLATMAPARVERLVLINACARIAAAPDFPFGVPDEVIRLLAGASDVDAVEHGIDVISLFAPSMSSDAAFRDWFDRAGNLALSPAAAQAATALLISVDVRDRLPGVEAPTLVIGRTGCPVPGFGPEHHRYLAEHIPNARLLELPGDEMVFWLGDTSAMLDEIEEFVTGARGGSGTARTLATVLFTDIVNSTSRAARLGDRAWRMLLERHDHEVRLQLARFRGREVKTSGDGFLATFDSPGQAIACAQAIREALRAVDLEVRAGIHTGEVEVRGPDIAGLAVHIGARIASLATAGEILVSATIPALVAGATTAFADRGEHELKGVPGRWRVYAVEG